MKTKPIDVPANCSRLFDSPTNALNQPLGKIDFKYDLNTGIWENKAFDESLIIYDKNYCTTNYFHYVGSTEYLKKMIGNNLFLNRKIVEIGCGQGEIVNWLNNNGVECIGFDPVCKNSSQNIFPEYWTPERQRDEIGNIENPIFLMRCVLPHIINPFTFIEQIFNNFPNAQILIEFQRLEWVFEHKLWNQISHDHVNMFSENNFEYHYNVILSGNFSNREWAYIFFDRNRLPKKSQSVYINLPELIQLRERELELIHYANKPISIFGSAGKGIVFAHALKSYSPNLSQIASDLDSNRIGKFMECSATEVLSHEEASQASVPGTQIIVMNPNHTHAAEKIFGNKFNVSTVGRIERKSS